MGLTALQPNPRRKELHAPPSGAKAAGTAPGKLLSRSTAIACSFILARQITFRNKIPTGRPVLDNDLRRWSGSTLTAVNRVVSQTLAENLTL
jgi:hypothetical protein